MEMKSISKVTLNIVFFFNIVKRMNLCNSVDGDRFEHLLQREFCETKLERMYYHIIKINNKID